MVVVGEVHTSLLQNSLPLSPEMARELLQLRPGEDVRFRSQPARIAWSPDLLTGVDCIAPLPPATRRSRLVGTLRSTVSVTEGQVLQVTTSTVVHRSDLDHRLPWSHYLAEPGTVELLGPVSAEVMTRGFLAGSHARDSLDLAAVNSRLLARVQRSAELDHQAPFSTRRTQVRWAARTCGPGRQHADFTIGPDGLRTLALKIPDGLTDAVSEFCSDLALHDWLLSSLRDGIDRAIAGPNSEQRAVQGLRAVMGSLAHTWGPGARVDDELRALWAHLESRARLETQWATAVARVRDYLQFRLTDRLLTDPLPTTPESRPSARIPQERR